LIIDFMVTEDGSGFAGTRKFFLAFAVAVIALQLVVLAMGGSDFGTFAARAGKTASQPPITAGIKGGAALDGGGPPVRMYLLSLRMAETQSLTTPEAVVLASIATPQSIQLHDDFQDGRVTHLLVGNSWMRIRRTDLRKDEVIVIDAPPPSATSTLKPSTKKPTTEETPRRTVRVVCRPMLPTDRTPYSHVGSVATMLPMVPSFIADYSPSGEEGKEAAQTAVCVVLAWHWGDGGDYD
jgi:hypothetical protein